MNGMQVSSSGPASASNLSGGSWVAPVFNALPIADPLAYVMAPVAGGCANSSPMNFSNPSSMTMSPGTYCGATSGSTTTPAVTIAGTYSNGKCTSTPSIVLQPGLYVIIGGMNLSCVSLSGTGVTVYLTRSSSVGYGQVMITNSTVNVSAPVDGTTGGLAGVVMMTDRNWSAAMRTST